MTVTNTSITSGPYIGNGASNVFSYTFKVNDKTQLSVYETDDDGTQTLLTVDTDYSVSDIGADSGGDVTRVAGALPTDHRWFIKSNYIETQLTAFPSQGSFFPEVHEAQFDHLTILVQQILEGGSRGFRLDGSLPLDGDFTIGQTAAQRANLSLGFDTDGNLVAQSLFDPSLIDQSELDRRHTVMFENVATMTNVSPVDIVGNAVTLTTGMIVQTSGYYTAGDQGAASYTVTTPQSFDDFGDHELGNNNIAVLKVHGDINIQQFGARGGAVDDTAAISALFAHINTSNNDTVRLSDGVEFQFTALTMPDDIVFSGSGTLTGPAPTGAKPTTSDIIAALSAGARNTLLTDYYNGTLTVSNVQLRGQCSLKNCLVTGSSASLQALGSLELDDVGFSAVALKARATGYINSTTGLITIDSPSDGLFVQIGGTIDAQQASIVYAAGRGCHIQFAGEIWSNNSDIQFNSLQGVFINQSGMFYGLQANISDNLDSGVLNNYGGSMILEGTTINNNAASGIVCESNGAFYAINAVITNNGGTGVDCSYDGVVQANGATITGNGGQAVRIRTAGVVDILGATVDRTNNGGVLPILWVQGRGVIYTEDETGTGKTALNANDYRPLYNELEGVAWMGDFSEHQDTAHRVKYLAYSSLNSNSVIAAGAATIANGWVSMDTEAFAASDDLDTMSEGSDLQRVILTAASSTRTVVIKHGTGNIFLDGGVDFSLDHQRDTMELIFQSGVWCELSRSSNS